MSPTLVHVAPHPDDEALGCPAALLHLLDRGWQIVSVTVSLGSPPDCDRRRAEFEEASRRAQFLPVFFEPPIGISLHDDLAAATERIARELPDIVVSHGASIVVSPSPHDMHHGHETVARGVQQAMAALSPALRWWMWGLWADLPKPNVFYSFGEEFLARVLHILEAYQGELTRNDYRRLVPGRASANAVLGSERVFGFGSTGAGSLPYAELLTEVRREGRRWMAAQAHHLDQGPLLDGQFTTDLTAWMESPSVRELVGPFGEASEKAPGS